MSLILLLLDGGGSSGAGSSITMNPNLNKQFRVTKHYWIGRP